jgi:hypothetical protein
MPDITAPWSTLRLLRNTPAAAPVEAPPQSAEDEEETAANGDEPQ